MKKAILVLLATITIASFGGMALGCSSSSGSSYSSGDSGYKSKYDRDADYVGDQFGKSGDEVKDSVDRMAGAMN